MDNLSTNLFFEIQRTKVHFMCDFPEDATPLRIKTEMENMIGIPVNQQILKMQLVNGDVTEWIVLDDNKKFVDQGYNVRLAKADNPAVLSLLIASEDDDINITRMSSPPPMPDAMRARDAPEEQ